MKDTNKLLTQLHDRAVYLLEIKQNPKWAGIGELIDHLQALRKNIFEIPAEKLASELEFMDERLSFLEQRAAKSLTSYETVNIVRNPARFTLQDILENVYDSFTELGGDGECNVDPAVVVARAVLTRRVKNKVYSHQVMVIGHEKGKSEEFRNGGSAKPWGNAKALHYMKVAETEGIPIHSFIFTPGAFPIEDYPGAAQAIARNLYEMAMLRTPVISFTSEGGSGGAEALGLSDIRLMGSRGYYSVISPEGAAAIEGKLREGEKVPKELIEHCAENLRITAHDNLKLGTIDRIVEEPPLGAKRNDYAFFRRLRYEMLKATDEVVLHTKSLKAFRAYAMKTQQNGNETGFEDVDVVVDWGLSDAEINRLLSLRSEKYRAMGANFYIEGKKGVVDGIFKLTEVAAAGFYELRYGLIRPHERNVRKVLAEVSSEGTTFLKKVTEPVRAAYDFIFPQMEKNQRTSPSQDASNRSIFIEDWEPYVSPLANEDKTVTCPNAHKYGCLDLWVPDLYGEFAGVCPTCGHHFPLEYRWYLEHLFDRKSVAEFNRHVASGNPLNFNGFEKRLEKDRKKTNRTSSVITFDAQVRNIKIVTAMFYSDFRNGTVGAAEGEKFVRACDRARMTRRPFLAYIHTTGGIRIHEGTVGVCQMPKCTLAVREYVESGGLYIVVYDNNSYAGPVASFLGAAPYQFAIRSTRLGFAGPRVIRETTGEDVPPDYHSAKNALKRGHIQGIWDRRDFRKNLHAALLTMGGPNLYYK